MLSISRPTNKPIPALADTELLAEWHYWNEKIKATTSWGVALAAANGFRKSCESQLNFRNIEIPKED